MTVKRPTPTLKIVSPAPARIAAPSSRADRSGRTEQIVASIIRAIVERRLVPGTKLNEQQVADVFQVSRTLVRQAFNRLSRDRLVTLEPGRGAFVAMPSIDEAREVFALRSMVESTVVRRLCTTITGPQLARLRDHLRAEKAAVAGPDVYGRTRLLSDFHVVLAQVFGNAVLAGLIADLLNRSSLISLMYQSTHSAVQSHAQHVAIVDALAARDVRRAGRLMEMHIDSVEENLQLTPSPHDLAAALHAGADLALEDDVPRRQRES